MWSVIDKQKISRDPISIIRYESGNAYPFGDYWKVQSLITMLAATDQASSRPFPIYPEIDIYLASGSAAQCFASMARPQDENEMTNRLG